MTNAVDFTKLDLRQRLAWLASHEALTLTQAHCDDIVRHYAGEMFVGFVGICEVAACLTYNIGFFKSKEHSLSIGAIELARRYWDSRSWWVYLLYAHVSPPESESELVNAAMSRVAAALTAAHELSGEPIYLCIDSYNDAHVIEGTWDTLEDILPSLSEGLFSLLTKNAQCQKSAEEYVDPTALWEYRTSDMDPADYVIECVEP